MRAAVCVAVLFFCSAAISAAEEMNAKADKTAPAPAGKEETVTGPLTSTEGKFTLRTVPDKETKSQPKKYVLWAEGDHKKTLETIVKNASTAEVTGMVAPDGTNMKVTNVTEIPRKKKK